MADLQRTDAAALAQWLTEYLAAWLGVSVHQVDPQAMITDYGMDSVTVVGMLADLESRVGFEIEPDLVWDFPTITALADHLAQHGESAPLRPGC